MRLGTSLLLSLTVAAPLGAAPLTTTLTYQSTVSTDGQGPLDLKAELNYDTTPGARPIAVVMHGFSGAGGLFDRVRPNAQRLRDAGFFVLSVAMRGREGSDGVRDSGGIEIHDIYDAVETVKRDFATHVDPSSVYITGYSGGGGNVMSAATKFPDYFRVASSYFGISDYGYNPDSGWYQNGASKGHRDILDDDLGDPTTGDPAVLDRYLARASNLAAMNNPYTEIHLFHNEDEPVTLPVNHFSYQQNAQAAASFDGEFDNITVHPGRPGRYVDLDGDGRFEAHEEQYWPHNAPTANQQAAAEGWYLDRLLDGGIPEPQLNPADTLFVAGFVKTRPFAFWLGDGQDAAGLLDYELGPDAYAFSLEVLSSDPTRTGDLEIDLTAHEGGLFEALLNGARVDTFTAGGWYTYAGLGDGDRLVLQAVPEPSSLLAGLSVALLLGAGRGRRGTRHVAH